MTDSRRDTERLLAGLLGPSSDELTCEQCFELLDLFVEHEVAGESADRELPECVNTWRVSGLRRGARKPARPLRASPLWTPKVRRAASGR